MSSRRLRAQARPKRVFDAFPDRIDLRDWPYQPTLAPLPDAIVNCARVPRVLDQGQEGACTGFALAAVINYLLAQRGTKRAVSPRMLYEMARCYDEWPGTQYEGSSARGAMKGWARHGVAEQAQWGDALRGREHLTPEISRAALAVPCGAYYRVNHKEVRDVHAALHEVGAVYCTLMVHRGWDAPGPLSVNVDDGSKTRRLPVIARRGQAESGHAVAFVGYTRDGFVVQNSWGTAWGARGFALLPYEDFLLHATDVWVAQLGVPLSVDLWAKAEGADSQSGRFRGIREIPLAEIRPYAIDVGNNGELSQCGNYWTSEADLARLFRETIPAAAAERGWPRKRVMLYLHGGLNSEDATARRVVAWRDKCLANGVYPLHVMWETGALETLAHTLGDLFTQADERAGGGLYEGLREAKDRVLELTARGVIGWAWSEMKENARRASDHRDGRGAMQLLRKHALGAADPASWELHVVAHSAGSVFFAHALEPLRATGLPLTSVQLMAPAIRIDAFKALVVPRIREGACPTPRLYVLSPELELGDDVGPYGKSVLWLVSNALEDARETPLLGLQTFLRADRSLARHVEVVESTGSTERGSLSATTTHMGFDSDPFTLNAVLQRILGRRLPEPFEKRDLDY